MKWNMIFKNNQMIRYKSNKKTSKQLQTVQWGHFTSEVRDFYQNKTSAGDPYKRVPQAQASGPASRQPNETKKLPNFDTNWNLGGVNFETSWSTPFHGTVAEVIAIWKF